MITNKKRSTGNDAPTQKNTGFNARFMPVCKAEDVANTADKTAETADEWITPTMIEKTDSLWSKRYGRQLEQSEILEILHNIRKFGQLIFKFMKGEMT